MKPATEKQRLLIAKIERLVGVKFEGTTISEASAFISKHLDQYKKEQEFVFDMIHNENHY